MATQARALTPQNEAIQILARLQKLFPVLPEPHKGVLSNACMVLKDPSLDTKFCELVGKVVHIKAKLSQNTDHEIALRGEKGPLRWNTDISSDKSNNTPQEKTFLFHVSPDQMNETLLFKFVAIANQALLWQRGDNCILDLSRYGHIVYIEIPGVTFPGL